MAMTFAVFYLPHDAALIPADPSVHTTHDLYASRKLVFAWVAKGNDSPLALQHPDHSGGLFFRLDLPFLAWVRGVCKREYEAGRTLSPEQQTAVNSVWCYVCHTYGITDDNPERLPAPSDRVPR